MAGTDLIFVSLENWDEIWRRNQFICAELANRHPEKKILFVAPARDVSASVRRLDFADVTTPAVRTLVSFPNIRVVRPLKMLPNSVPFCRTCNVQMMRLSVKRAARDFGLVAPMLWLNPYDAGHLLGHLGERGAVYDITDDWTQFPHDERVRARIIRDDTELCRRADAVIVCSSDLFNSRRNLARKLVLVENGVDAAHYRTVLDGDGPLPASLRARPKPVMGYTGTLHSARLDLGLLMEIASAMPTSSIVLIGPDHLTAEEHRRLATHSNIAVLPSVPYADLPAYMRAFDVAIVPHLVNAFTESLNPLKLWEYLAAGKPIVSTNVAGFREHSTLVHLASDAKSFVAAVHAALQEDPTLPERRRAEAAGHSWAQRVDVIEDVMRSVTSDKAPRPAAQTARS